MHSVNISELRANLLTYLQKANNGEPISVTSNGKLLAIINAPEDQQRYAQEKLAKLAESAAVYDLVSPLDEPWEVLE